MIYRSQGELDTAVYYWQGVLGLRDWTVRATLSRRYEFDEDDQQGLCEVHENNRYARIWVLSHEDYSAYASFPQDHEETLVHEMLHIHLHPLEPKDYDERLEIAKEQAVNAISVGLASLKRKQLGE